MEFTIENGVLTQCVGNDEQVFMDYLDKYNMLEIYAKMRGVTVSALRSKKSKTSLKADGTMSFDL